MLKNRSIPFGYCMMNGKYALNDLEAGAVRNDFVNITLHDYLKKTRFFGAPPIFTERSGVNIGGGPAA